MSRLAPLTAVIIAALVLLIGSYMGAYYGMLTARNLAMVFLDTRAGVAAPPVYRRDCDWVDAALSPAHLHLIDCSSSHEAISRRSSGADLFLFRELEFS